VENIESPVTHICIVGDDLMPIVTPIIDKEIPSDRLVIVFHPDHKNNLKALTQLIQSRGYIAENWPLPKTDCTETIKSSLQELFALQLEKPGSTWFNASTGKHFSLLTAYEIARSYKLPIYTVESKQDYIYWLHPYTWLSKPISDRLTLREFFILQNMGYALSTTTPVKTMYDLAIQWAQKTDSLKDALGRLNYLSHLAQRDNNTSPEMDLVMLKDNCLQWLLGGLLERSLISIDNNRIHFKSESNRFFACGGWLELLTYKYLLSLKSEIKIIHGVAHSAEITRNVDNQQILNEIDVLALVNNKLHLIECKTKRFTQSNANDVLYKIDSLTDLLGGLESRAALVSFHSLNKRELARAREARIHVFGPESLPNLKEALRRWLQDA